MSDEGFMKIKVEGSLERIEASTKDSWLSEGLFMFLAPVGAYSAFFAYKFGYYWHLGIPFYLITVDPEEMIIGSCFLLILLKKRLFAIAVGQAVSSLLKILSAVIGIILPALFVRENISFYSQGSFAGLAYPFRSGEWDALYFVLASLLFYIVEALTVWRRWCPFWWSQSDQSDWKAERTRKKQEGAQEKPNRQLIADIWTNMPLPSALFGILDLSFLMGFHEDQYLKLTDAEKADMQTKREMFFVGQCYVLSMVFLLGLGVHLATTETVFNMLKFNNALVVIEATDTRVLCVVRATDKDALTNREVLTTRLLPEIVIFSGKEAESEVLSEPNKSAPQTNAPTAITAEPTALTAILEKHKGLEITEEAIGPLDTSNVKASSSDF